MLFNVENFQLINKILGYDGRCAIQIYITPYNNVCLIFLLQFICEPNNVHKVRTFLEKLKYDIVQAEEEHLPLQQVSLNELEYKHLTKFINNIEELPDVIQVYDNVAQLMIMWLIKYFVYKC